MATNGNDMLRYATFAVCAVIVGVYASNNTALKNGLAASEAKNASVVAETVRLKAEIAESSGKAAVFSCADPSVTVSQSGTGAGASVTFAVPWSAEGFSFSCSRTETAVQGSGSFTVIR